jgi:hypothetical protein
MNSNSSSEINVNYLDTNGNKIDSKITEVKKQVSDTTEYHFGMIANQEKIINIKSETSTDLENIVNSSETKNSSTKKSVSSSSSSSSSKPRIDDIKFNKSETFNNFNIPKEPVNPTFNSNIPNIPNLNQTTVPINNLSPQEIRMKKIELLRRLCEIKAKGYALTKEYDFNSSIEEMEYEYALLKSFADKRNGTKLYKNILLNGISLIEYLNDKYDPFEFQLKGWSEHMSFEIDSYEDIIEELYEKYKTTGKSAPPELRLILLILASGAAFHFSKTQLASIPGVSSAATSMMGKMMSTKKDNKYMSPQEAHLEKQKQELREKERQMKEQRKVQSNSNSQPAFNSPPAFNPPSAFNPPPAFNPMLQQEFSAPNINNINNLNHNSLSRDIPEIRAPNNVQEILSRIKTIQNNNSINTTETQEESTINNDRLVSDSTFSENKKKGRKAKKPTITIDTI